MAKKKVKKKKGKKKVIRLASAYQLRMLLEKKRLSVMLEVGEVDCTGTHTAADGEKYSFTEAHHVFELYREAFIAEGLTVFPAASPELKPQLIPLGRYVGVIGYYEICDVDTGFSILGWGMGVGENAFWAANSAQTRAMKQFLLNAGLASWHDPEEVQSEKRAAAVEAWVEEQLRLRGVDNIREFWSKELGEKTDDRGKKHSNTVSSGKGNPQHRKGAKRRNRPS